LSLCLTEFRPPFPLVCIEVGQLNEEEWEISLTPVTPPILNQCLEQFRINRRLLHASIALALEPYHSTNGKTGQWRNHSVVEPAWRGAQHHVRMIGKTRRWLTRL